MFTIFPLNLTLGLVPTKSNKGSRNLVDLIGALILSSDSHLDFHDKIILDLSLAVLIRLCIG